MGCVGLEEDGWCSRLKQSFMALTAGLLTNSAESLQCWEGSVVLPAKMKHCPMHTASLNKAEIMTKEG